MSGILVLLKNVVNGRLVGLPRDKADDLLQNSYALETIKKPNWEEIAPNDPQYKELCAIADGKDRQVDESHSDHWAQMEEK